MAAEPQTSPKQLADPDQQALPFPELFAFLGSGSLLVLEIVAGRLIAPSVGVSLYTWTSVIGVVLAGITVGNWLGGRLADQRPSRTVLSMIYLGGAAASALILLFARDVDAFTAPTSWPAIIQVLWICVLMFLPAAILLGMPTPMIVKLTLSSLDDTGRVVGRVQAAASAGSILGVFLTGFALISWFGTRAIVAGVVGILLLLALGAHPILTEGGLGRKIRSQPAFLVVPLVIFFGAIGFTASAKSSCIEESNYFCIDVGPDPSGQFRELRLDLLVHGVMDPNHPAELHYPYQQLYEQVTKASFKPGSKVSTFQIGGGTYSYPDYLAAHYDAHTVVSEIDPEVTKTAREHFALKDTPEIVIDHQDARVSLKERPKDERYDLVLGDAFNDIAVPYHLTTKEFNDEIAKRLTPRGYYLCNVVDGKDYDFLRAFLTTLKKSFKYVGLMTPPGQSAPGERATFVTVAANHPLPALTTIVTYDRLQPFIAEKKSVELTDDHVPVDQLLAPVYGDSIEQHSAEQQGSGG